MCANLNVVREVSSSLKLVPIAIHVQKLCFGRCSGQGMEKKRRCAVMVRRARGSGWQETTRQGIGPRRDTVNGGRRRTRKREAARGEWPTER